MNIFSRRNADKEKWGERLPPGQKDAGDGWPVLHYGSIPRVDTESWRFEVGGLVEAPVVWTWQEFMDIGSEKRTNDIHCVTAWSKFDNEWQGIPVLEVMKQVQLKPEAKHVMVHSYGGYTTNLPIEDLLRPENLFATFMADERPGFWEMYGYHIRGDPFKEERYS
jgi:DMSO/TMAO reductase YedYZ molybdopterin-dependent catalytic subunit